MFLASQTQAGAEPHHLGPGVRAEQVRHPAGVREAMLSRLIGIDSEGTGAAGGGYGLGMRDPIVPAEAPVPAGAMDQSPMLQPARQGSSDTARAQGGLPGHRRARAPSSIAELQSRSGQGAAQPYRSSPRRWAGW